MKYADLKKNDIVDTPSGIVVSVWFQGCPMHCLGCHNPGTWDPKGGKEIDLEILIKEILESLNKNGIERNLALLGGEPLAPYNIKYSKKIIEKVKEKFPNKKIFLWTGYTYDFLKHNLNKDLEIILSNIDLLVEGPYKQELRDITLSLRGSSNQHILVKGKDF